LAASERLASFGVCDRHRDPADDPVVVAEAGLCSCEADEQGPVAGDVRTPIAEGDVTRGDRREVVLEELEGAGLAVVERKNDVGVA
jgi:hypothetical protein